MNRSSFALFVAILIHFLLMLVFWILGSIAHEIKKPVEPKEERIKVSLKEIPKKPKDAGITKQIHKPPEMAPPMPKGKQLKKIEKSTKTVPIKKPPIKYEPKKIEQKKSVKKQPINLPKPEPIMEPKPIIKPKPKIKKLPPKKKHIKLKPKVEKPKIKKPKPKYDSYDWLMEDRSNEEVKKEKKKVNNGSRITNDIKELYGDEFGKLTPGQQKYILDNREIMRRITQQILTRVARVNLKRDINVNRVNIIEFYLHPNGDMTDFKFLKKSGYYTLDRTTKETIGFAYSRYPRPKEKILIRYNVFYNLARY